MKTKIQLLLLCLVVSLTAMSQISSITLKEDHACGFDKILEKVNVNYIQWLEAYREQAVSRRSANQPEGVLYDIPVVFHIVHAANQSNFNIPDSILINQIDVLNKAYRKRHADTSNTRAVFKPLSIDAEIQFHLATLDPLGKPTNGITRTISKRTHFGDATGSLDSLERVKKKSQGGIDPWPTKKYLNIWVCNLTDANGQLSVLGYAVPPLNPLPGNWPSGIEGQLSALIDGVVLQTHSVGSNNPLSAALQGLYTKGRCCVHEVGHYLGLQHVFGSTGGNSTANCGTALITDGMNDTPEQALISQAKGCPAADKNSCGAGTSGDLPDMWENYMDYSTDACQTMFTKDQIALMRSVLDDQRSTLVNTTTPVNEESFPAIVLYPNPATDVLHTTYPGIIHKVTAFNYMGQVVAELTGQSASSQTYHIRELQTGSYLFLFETENGKVFNAKCNIIK